MFTVLLVIHVLVTLALIGVVLIQRSEGGGLGIGGGQGMGSFMTGRGTANLLTRTSNSASSIFNAPAPMSAPAPTTLPAPSTPPAPSKPAVPATP
jgi:preprotein translocase subunit SecG